MKMYADDSVVYIYKPFISIPKALHMITSFGEMSQKCLFPVNI